MPVYAVVKADTLCAVSSSAQQQVHVVEPQSSVIPAVNSSAIFYHTVMVPYNRSFKLATTV